MTTPSPALAALSGAPIGRTHRRVLLIVSAMFLFDLADLNTFAFAAPAIRAVHGFTVQDVALVTAMSFAGMAVGAVLGGRAADLLGRRLGMSAAVAVFSAASLLNAVVSTPGPMATARALTGFGLGAMTAIAISYLSEVTPATHRGRFQAVTLGVGLVGIPLVAFTARGITVSHPAAWRWLFVAGALGFLLLPFVLRLPESPRWLLSRGRAAEAAETVRRFVPDFRGGQEQDQPSEPAAADRPKARFRDLFAPGQRRNSVVMMVVWAFALTGFYGFQSWVPTLLADRGQDFARSMTMSAITTIGAVPGAFLATPFIDRFSRKHLAVALGLIVAAVGLGYGLSTSTGAVMVFGVLVAALSQAYIAVLYSYTPEHFPTALRTAGSGLGNGAGRAANIVAPLVIAAVYTAPQLGYVGVFAFVAGAWLIATLTVAFFGIDTRGRALEELHGRPPQEDPVRPGSPSPTAAH
ncbi:MFS transporter [Streptomyces ochraceiscleroticus]|uniref:MFS transporter n=1 Tax=Streptomyces ochraceiscleroticus TaxID=47761 RepID=A0ABW1MHX7_9ACTN|nr:MFS transporter [Streptomyces ochraceiscleroticus]